MAVVPITLFHAGISSLPGGFLGVDVFFVISGFLITNIISHDIDRGSFSILEFYKKRIARIFPALFCMIFVTLLAGCLTIFPIELEKLGASAISAASFVGNIYFWYTTDYFGSSADSTPLLHTWSLGVEEQFYIFFPIFIIVGKRYFPRFMVPSLAILTAISALSGPIIAHYQPEAAFYLLPSRAWQLALGSLIAVGNAPSLRQPMREIVAGIGFSFIIIGYFFVHSEWMLPFPWGLFPSAGTALVIAYGDGTAVGRALSHALLGWVGAISYSLYLWHWPIITFYRIETGNSLDFAESVGLILAAALVASASYYLIEQPALRFLRKRGSIAVISGGAVCLATMVGVCAFIALHPAGWRNTSAEALRISNYAAYKGTPTHFAQFREGLCFSTSESAAYDFARCTALDPTKRNFALIGDSHAAQYWLALQKRMPDVNLIQLTSSGCRILINAKGASRCTHIRDYTFGKFLDRGNIDQAILAGRWRLSDFPKLKKTIELLNSKAIPVLVIGPVDEFSGDFPLLLARAYDHGNLSDVERDREGKVDLDVELSKLVNASGARYYSAQKAECSLTSCTYFSSGGIPLHFDYGHLTEAGAEYILRDLPSF